MPDEPDPSGSQTSSPTGTNSSLSSADRFGLDANDTGKILVYEYRGGPVKTTSQRALCRTLDKGNCFHQLCGLHVATHKRLINFTDPRLRCSKLAIPRGKSRLQIHQEDLYPEQLREREEYVELPNAKNNLASILIPRLVYWGRLLGGKYKNLYIVSPSSPSNSPNNSPENSQFSNSRSHTFHSEQEATTQGAEIQ